MTVLVTKLYTFSGAVMGLVDNLFQVYASVLEHGEEDGVVLGLRRRRVDVEGWGYDGRCQHQAYHAKGYGGSPLGAASGAAATTTAAAGSCLILGNTF